MFIQRLYESFLRTFNVSMFIQRLYVSFLRTFNVSINVQYSFFFLTFRLLPTCQVLSINTITLKDFRSENNGLNRTIDCLFSRCGCDFYFFSTNPRSRTSILIIFILFHSSFFLYRLFLVKRVKRVKRVN